ncbi:MAG: hypothetical protein PHV34_18995 [Verrucomicrobiae bacterium]|nr:hypothetical protein [Verrucomicrobiae bacterium]
MNQNVRLFSWMLVILFGISALFNGFLVFKLIAAHGDVDRISRNINTLQPAQLEATTRNVVNDLAVLGQKHPAILNLLRKYGVTTVVQPNPPAPAPAPSSPSKPR